MKKNNELRDCSMDELKAELLNLRKDQFKLRMSKSTETPAKKHVITAVRKAIARVKTIMREKGGMHHA